MALLTKEGSTEKASSHNPHVLRHDKSVKLFEVNAPLKFRLGTVGNVLYVLNLEMLSKYYKITPLATALFYFMCSF